MCLRVTFATPLPSQWSLKIIKALSLRLNQCFGQFTLSYVDGSSQTGPFRLLSKHVFRCRQFRKYISYERHLFLKMFEIQCRFEKCIKNWEKIFCFWDKWIWIVSIQLSLLIREYLSSVVNVLKKRLKNFQVSKSNFCNSITFRVITQDDKGALIKIQSVHRPVYHIPCRGVISNGTFQAFI